MLDEAHDSQPLQLAVPNGHNGSEGILSVRRPGDFYEESVLKETGRLLPWRREAGGDVTCRSARCRKVANRALFQEGAPNHETHMA